jgi:two-component system sensor histidine kinase EvgS
MSPEETGVDMPSRGRVLIVDDNADIREVLARELANCGFTTATANSAQSGIARIRQFMPDVILCDVALPRIDGGTFGLMVRSNPHWIDIVLVAFSSALVTVAEMARLLSIGFKKVVTMPSAIDSLCELLAGRDRRMLPRDGSDASASARHAPHMAEPEPYGYASGI